MPTEKSITAKIMKYLARIPRGFVQKRHGSRYGVAGIPDIEFIWRGRVLFIEVKRPGRHATALQARVMDRLREAGAFVVVVHSFDEFLDELARFQHEALL